MSVEVTSVTPEAVYVYTDERGRPLFEVVRLPGKKFFQRKPDGTPGLDGVRRVPYRLAEVILSETVFLTEGEKDVETLRKLGLVASTNPGGANGWRTEFAEYFRGKHIIVLPDQDAPGGAWAARVLRDLTPVGKTLKRIDLPGLEFGSGGDISDWLAAGHTKGELLNLVEQSEFFPPVSINAGDALEDSTIPAWPESLAAEAFHGLAGEIVRAIEPQY
jgi:putative DNA primase/helicase